jgi:hypothetical protein
MQIAAIVEKPEISRAEPTVVGERLCGLVRQIEIAGEYSRSAS